MLWLSKRFLSHFRNIHYVDWFNHFQCLGSIKIQVGSTPPLKIDLLFLLTTKPKYSSFFSIWSKDFKNVIFEIGWPSPFRGRWGRTFEIVSNQKNKGGLFQQLSKISSKIIFSLLWPRGRPFDLTDLRRVWVDFCKITFLKSREYTEKNKL